MTPSMTFQCPLSPSGITQPVRSLPLNSDTKPASLVGAAAATGAAGVLAGGAEVAQPRTSTETSGRVLISAALYQRCGRSHAAEAWRGLRCAEVVFRRSRAPRRKVTLR